MDSRTGPSGGPLQRRKPDFFIMGAPKCGTTALASYLSQHPLIRLSVPKEPHYFCKDLATGAIPVTSDTEYLDRFFPGLDDCAAIAAGEASVWQLYSRSAASAILEFQPEARFVVALRNPVDMVYSLYNQMRFMGQEDAGDVLAAWQLQSTRRQGQNTPRGLTLDIKLLFYKDACALGTQLQRLLSRVTRERVHVVLNDDLAANPRAEYVKLLQFLGVPDDSQKRFPPVNAARRMNSQLLVRVANARPVVSSVSLLKRLLRIDTLGIGRPYAPIPASTREYLLSEFDEEISLLEELLDRRLGWR